MKDYGLIAPTAKTFGKRAQAVFAELPDKFRKPIIADSHKFIKVDAEVEGVLRSANLDVVAGHLMFPGGPQGTHKVKVRETKHGVFVAYTTKRGSKSEIVLAKDGNHIAYARKLYGNKREHFDQNGDYINFGTLKEASWSTKTGIHTGYMRDTVGTQQTLSAAVENNRYAVDKAEGGLLTPGVIAVIRVWQ